MWWSITYKNVNEVLVGAVKWMKIPADSQSYCRGKTWHRVRTRAIVRACEPTLPGVRGRGPALSMRCACADAASGILQKKKKVRSCTESRVSASTPTVQRGHVLGLRAKHGPRETEREKQSEGAVRRTAAHTPCAGWSVSRLRAAHSPVCLTHNLGPVSS